MISRYISKPDRALLKEKGINYLDTSGNCYVQQGSLFIYINDKIVTPQRQPESGKLWKPAGLRFLFTLLQNPGLLNQPYRKIATESNIALGTVGALLQELKNEEFIIKVRDLSILSNTNTLVSRWTENFCSTLLPKLLQGKFRFVKAGDRENWKNIHLWQAWWGGEPAGGLLTGYLHPEKFTLYSNLPKTEVMKQLHVVPDVNGEVALLKPFWNTDAVSQEHKDCVPALLVYAELHTSLDSRNRETAKRMKKELYV